MRKAGGPKPPPLEAPPDVKSLVRGKLDAVFTAASHPTRVQISHRRVNDLHGRGWTACVKAELTSVMGKTAGHPDLSHRDQRGALFSDRQRIEAEDTCENESYEPI